MNGSPAMRCSSCHKASAGPTHPHYCRGCWNAYQRRRWSGEDVTTRTCPCGVEFTTTDARKRFHSRECKEAHHRERLKVARAARKPARTCLDCGGAIPKAMRADAAYCSEACNSRAHNATRKASVRLEARQGRISRAAIIARDDGVCWICGKRPAPDEIHLDHKVPLACGGTHDEDNLAVACATCNLRKGARWWVAPLRPESFPRDPRELVTGALPTSQR